MYVAQKHGDTVILKLDYTSFVGEDDQLSHVLTKALRIVESAFDVLRVEVSLVEPCDIGPEDCRILVVQIDGLGLTLDELAVQCGLEIGRRVAKQSFLHSKHASMWTPTNFDCGRAVRDRVSVDMSVR